MEKYRADRNDMYESIEEPDNMDKLGQGFTSADPLEEVDIGDGSVPRPTYINKNLETDYKAVLIRLVKEYIDCFAWEYHEMPGLSRELVEHRLPIKAGFKPHKQPARRFSPYYDRVKKEIGRLLKAEFIRPCRYAEWISNIVLVEKKGSGKIRACIRDIITGTRGSSLTNLTFSAIRSSCPLISSRQISCESRIGLNIPEGRYSGYQIDQLRLTGPQTPH